MDKNNSGQSTYGIDNVIPNSVLFNKTSAGGRVVKSPVSGQIDHKDIESLKKFTSEKGRILPRRLTNLTAVQQRRVKKAIKRARILALMPFAQKNW